MRETLLGSSKGRIVRPKHSLIVIEMQDLNEQVRREELEQCTFKPNIVNESSIIIM